MTCATISCAIIDYIVVHGLRHFHHQEHADTFWNEVD